MADYYRQVADELIARGHVSYDRAHPNEMTEQDRKSFKQAHDLYYPRKRDDILIKNIAYKMDDPAGIATEYLKMIKNRKLLEGDDVFLSHSPLGEAMAIKDFENHVTAQRRSALNS